MLFAREQVAAIIEGRITLTIRRWSRPQAKLGGRYRLGPDGVVVADEVVRVSSSSLTTAEARASGFRDLDELQAFLGDPPADESLTRVRFHYEREVDHRLALGHEPLDDAGLAELERRLARLDTRYSEPWTRATLAAIESRPRIRAANLAAALGRETLEFKADVRRLKALALTRSLEVGYELTPRGAAYLRATATGTR